MSQPVNDHGPEYRHVDDMSWETLRFLATGQGR